MSKTSTLKYWLKLSLKLKNKPLILSAGMPRSGSTLLFNILRVILSERWSDQLSAGWEGYILQLPEGKAYLVKTHNINRFYKFRAKHAFYTYRDVRVAAVSNMRKFNLTPTVGIIRSYIEEYMVASQFCDQMIKYEDFVSKPSLSVQKIAEALGISVDSEEIIEKTFNLSPPKEISGIYSKETLLHKGHFTNTKDDEWRSLLSDELKENINEEFSWWFEKCGYSTT